MAAAFGEDIFIANGSLGGGFDDFPVMTAGMGLPLIMTRFGGNVTIVAAVGMLSRFCGTLLMHTFVYRHRCTSN